MRIKRIHVDGFGELSGWDSGDLDGPLTVIYGPNEAGKSTLLAFVRTALFGFPDKKRADFYPALRGGRHGGRLTVIDDRGAEYLVERYENAGGQAVRVTGPDGRGHDNDGPLRVVLGQASRPVFENVFAFSLNELQRLESLNEDDVSAQIYSAGMGAARLPAALKRIDADRERIFKGGGSRQEIAAILRDIEEVERKLAQTENDAAEYGRLLAQRKQIEDDLAGLEARLSDLRSRQREIQHLLAAWGDAYALRECEKKIADLPPIADFPEDGVTRLEEAEKRKKEYEQIWRDARSKLEDAEGEATLEIADEAILGHATQIDAIREGTTSFRNSVRDLPERQGELRGLERDLADSLLALGPDWNEERLRSFDTSIAVRDAAEQWQKRLDAAESALRDARANAERERRPLEEARRASQEAREKARREARPELDEDEIGRRRAILRESRTLLKDYELASLRFADQKEGARRASPPATLPILLAVAGIAAAVVGLILGRDAAILGGVFGLALLLASAYALLERRRSGATGSIPLAEARAALERSREALETAVAPLLTGIPKDHDLDAIEQDLDRAGAALRAWSEVQREVEATSRREQQCEGALQDATERLEAARQELDRAQSAWAHWLLERGLPDTLQPGAALVLFERVEKARDFARDAVGEMRRRVGAIQKDIAEYARLVAPLAREFGIQAQEDDAASIASAAERLVARFGAAAEGASRRRRALERAAEARKDAEAAERRLQDARAELESLLEKGGTDDPEEFRRRAALYAERQELQRQSRDLEERLRKEALSGGLSIDEFCQRLAATNEDELRSESGALEGELQEAEAKLKELVEERGRVLNSLEALAHEERASDLRAERELLKERLRAHARRWSALTTAAWLLERARARYQEERQPGVIQHAQDFFRTVTAGRYERIVAPLGQQQIEVIERDGTTKKPEQLSRGTQEQLYLALRFGLIRQFGDQETRLPVAVDEILVNFDAARARAAAEAFAKLSETNQVLVFTCLQNMVDLFTSVVPHAPVITLGESGEPPAAFKRAARGGRQRLL